MFPIQQSWMETAKMKNSLHAIPSDSPQAMGSSRGSGPWQRETVFPAEIQHKNTRGSSLKPVVSWVQMESDSQELSLQNSSQHIYGKLLGPILGICFLY